MEGEPNVLVVLSLAAFVPIAVGCFWALSPRRAVLGAMLGGWLFLPWFDPVGRSIPLLHTKAMFVPAIVLMASLAFDFRTWRRLRLAWVDLPVVVWCVAFAAPSITNDFGAYDAAAGAFSAAMTWGAPYLLGRAYFGDVRSTEQFASALVTGALAYVPVCAWEIRMSPQLHRIIFGFQQHSFAQHVRFGGFRPMGFLYHGLMVGLFMACGTLCAYWLWRTWPGRRLLGLSMGWAVALLAVTTVLCKATGATVLLATGIALLEGTRRLRTSLLVLCLAAAPAAYCGARIGGWSGDAIVGIAARYVNRERAESLGDRLYSEEILMDRALERPWTGWGRWGDSRVKDEWGSDAAETDGLWIITLGVAGLPGLLALGGVLALPALALLRRHPGRRWDAPAIAPAAALATIVLLFAVDSLPNAMVMPIFPAAAGVVLSFCLLCGRRRAARPTTARLVSSEASRAGMGAWEQRA